VSWSKKLLHEFFAKRIVIADKRVAEVAGHTVTADGQVLNPQGKVVASVTTEFPRYIDPEKYRDQVLKQLGVPKSVFEGKSDVAQGLVKDSLFRPTSTEEAPEVSEEDKEAAAAARRMLQAAPPSWWEKTGQVAPVIASTEEFKRAKQEEEKKEKKKAFFYSLRQEIERRELLARNAKFTPVFMLEPVGLDRNALPVLGPNFCEPISKDNYIYICKELSTVFIQRPDYGCKTSNGFFYFWLSTQKGQTMQQMLPSRYRSFIQFKT